MNQFEQFNKAIQVSEVAKNLYTLKPDTKYFVGNTPHGGYLMAIMHKTLVTVLPHSTAISSSVQYLDRIEDADISIEVEILRISKGSSSGIVKIIQDNKICVTLSGTCSDFEHMKGFDGISTPFPNIFHEYDKSKYVKMNYDKISKGFTPSFIQQLNCEIHPDHAWWDRVSHENAEARCSAFLEMSGGIPDQFALSFYSDILPPVVCNKYGALGWIPTLTLTTHIRQMPTTNELFVDFQASDINKGYFEQDCNIWDLNENLVASSRQLTRILKSEEKLSK
ncbi:thioesterase family protein [Gammaproteobacteria bacterium]|nr:thioesterase family protein [Gammaproteobacteria bacterium]